MVLVNRLPHVRRLFPEGYQDCYLLRHVRQFRIFTTLKALGTVGKKKKKGKEKRNTSIYFHTNYRTEMKLVPIIMD